MAKIKTLTVHRFKQLEHLELDLTDTTVLIGSNNSGKSSALQALHFGVAVAQTARIVGEGVKWATDSFELSFNPSQLLYSPIADVLALAHGGNLTESATDQIEVHIELTSGEKCKIAVRRGRNRNIGVSLRGRSVGERLMSLDKPFTVYAPGLAGIAKEERYMSRGVVRRVVARGDANLALRNVLLMIHEQEQQEKEDLRRSLQENAQRQREAGKPVRHWWTEWNEFKGPFDRFQDDMRALFPGIEFKVSFDYERAETIDVSFRTGDLPWLPIDAAGTSILQASQILAYVTLFKPEVLILDEPDSHLHPNNQRALCDLLTSLAQQRGFKALISTHSRHVLDSLKDRAQVVWINKGKKVAYDTLSTPAMLMDLGALDTVDYFANGHFSCLVATEDSSQESLLALKTLLDSNAFPMQEVEIRPYSGCSKLDSAKVLCGFLKDKAPNVKFVLHRDWDYMEAGAASKLEAGLKGIGAHPFLTEGSDIESYFLNGDHIASLNPPLTADRARELVQQATAAVRLKSIEALINIRTEHAIRNRNGGPPHNAGELAQQAFHDYDSAPETWRRGKLVLNQLKALLHQELGKTPVLLQKSKHLKSPRLQEIRDLVWPAAPSAPAAGGTVKA